MRAAAFIAIAAALALSGCDDDEQAGAACDVPADCYPDVDQATLRGTVECLDRVPGGYCTHLCNDDTDCCAVEGECRTGIRQVCAPFENSTIKRCFIACEVTDIGDREENAYCREEAHEAFGCRSTGGGTENRKVCVP